MIQQQPSEPKDSNMNESQPAVDRHWLPHVAGVVDADTTRSSTVTPGTVFGFIVQSPSANGGTGPAAALPEQPVNGAKIMVVDVAG